jgi:hypothetical protein
MCPDMYGLGGGSGVSASIKADRGSHEELLTHSN